MNKLLLFIKMNKLLLFIFIISLLFVGLASASVTQNNIVRYGIIEANGSLTTTSTSITGSNVLGFVCSTDDCSSVSSQIFSNAIPSSSISLTYPTVLQGTGYGLFFYKNNYIPYEVKANWAGEGSASDGYRYLTQKRFCSSLLSTPIVNNNNGSVTISLDVQSPIGNAGPLNYIPSALNAQYSIDVNVLLQVTGTSASTQTKTLSLAFSETKGTSFNLNLAPGTYTFTIVSSTSDPKCISSANQTKTTTLTIPGPVTCNTNSDCGTNSFIGPRSCSGNNVTQNFITFTCNNAGTSQSYCSNSTSPSLITSCPDYCSDGTCQTFVCNTNSDCGTNGPFGSLFCIGSNVSQLFRTFTCNNPGTILSSCSSANSTNTIQTCTYSCSDGTCQNPELIDLSVKDGFTLPSPLYTNSASPGIMFHTNNTGNETLQVPITIIIDGAIIPFLPTLPFQAGYNTWGVGGISEVTSSAGMHNFTMLIDPENNISESNENNNVFTFIYEVLPAPTYPINLTITYPTQGLNITHNNGITLNYTVQGPADSCWYSLDNGANISLPGCTSTTFDAGNGEHSIIVYANNSLGEVFPSTSVSFNVSGPVACYTNLDCGAPIYSNNYCSGSSVFQNVTSFTCHLNGQVHSYCSNSTAPQLVQTCQNTCSNGACVGENNNSLNNITITRPTQNEIFNRTTNLPLEFLINGYASSCWFNIDGLGTINIPCQGPSSFDAAVGNHTITVFASNSTVTVSDSKFFSVQLSYYNCTTNCDEDDGGNGGSGGSGGSSGNRTGGTSYGSNTLFFPELGTETDYSNDSAILLGGKTANKESSSLRFWLILALIIVLILIIILVAAALSRKKK